MSKVNSGIETPKISRRTFIKSTGAVAATAAVAGSVGLSGEENAVAATEVIDESNAEIFHTSCTMECLHHNLKGYVVDGKLVKVEVYEGEISKCCLRGLSRTQLVNHPDRLTMPLLRTGEKGSNEWEEISWDEALDMIVEKINETKEELGNQGLSMISGSGSFCSLNNNIGTAFFNYLGGFTSVTGNTCCPAFTTALAAMYGQRSVDNRDAIWDAKYILSWGNNPTNTMQSYWARYKHAMENGARLVTIDPVFTETAAKSDEWVPILPSADAALGLGMLKIIIEEELYDADFLKEHTLVCSLIDKSTGTHYFGDASDSDSYMVYDTISGAIVRHDTEGIDPAFTLTGEAADLYNTEFELIYAEAAIYDLETVEAETDVPTTTVERLARDYATIKPGIIVDNMGGFQRVEYGTYSVGIHCYLAAFTGNIGKPGAGLINEGGATSYVAVNSPISTPLVSETFGDLPKSTFGQYILADKPNKIGFLLNMTSNIMTQQPNTQAIKEALIKIPFVVTIDNLMSSTALYSDLVLPCTTGFEDENLLFSSRNHLVQLLEAAVTPPGEAKTDLWIFTELAKRFGFGEAFDKTPEEHIRACLEGSGITYEELKEKKVVNPVPSPYYAYAGGNFSTSTGKANLFQDNWVTTYNTKGVVQYVRANEFIYGDQTLVAKYPLMAVQIKTNRTIHSTFGTLPWIDQTAGDTPRIHMNSEDAAERGIEHGEWIVAYNDRGEHKGLANTKGTIKKGVIAVENGWWEQQGGASSYITNDVCQTFGDNGTCINNTLVEVRKEV